MIKKSQLALFSRILILKFATVILWYVNINSKFMKKSLIKRFCFYTPVLFLYLTIFSCSSTKKIKYFQDIPDSGVMKTIAKAEYSAPTIQVDDIITILVQTIDPVATQMINSGNLTIGTSSSASMGVSVPGLASLASATSQSGATGYLVDKDGFVYIPVLGKIKALGLTTFELRAAVYNEAVKYYKDPTVIVRYANFKVTVAGEVLRPGQYIMPNEKVNIIDALAMAGDLTVFGKRENVLLLRENLDGTKSPYRINLKKSNILSSPNYFLRQNDIIYVEPRKAKSDATDAAQQKYITIAGALLSIILVLAYRVK